jgi:hypothetical protein
MLQNGSNRNKPPPAATLNPRSHSTLATETSQASGDRGGRDVEPYFTSLEISYEDLLRMMCTFHVYLQMMMIYRQKLQTQL